MHVGVSELMSADKQYVHEKVNLQGAQVRHATTRHMEQRLQANL